MDWEKAQTFTFNTNAADVCAHIMGKENWREDNQAVYDVTDGRLALRAYLSVTVTPNTLYSIGFMGWMTYGSELDESYYASWIVERVEVAELVLIQESEQQCKAELYIETDPRRWGSDRTDLWHVGPRLVGLIWNDIVETWLEQQGRTPSAPENTAPKEPRGMKLGTAERVREMHRLLKQGLSLRQAKRQAKCDPATYYHWCYQATGEEPIQPYR